MLEDWGEERLYAVEEALILLLGRIPAADPDTQRGERASKMDNLDARALANKTIQFGQIWCSKNKYCDH
jgi:hypothetical protein